MAVISGENSLFQIAKNGRQLFVLSLQNFQIIVRLWLHLNLQHVSSREWVSGQRISDEIALSGTMADVKVEFLDSHGPPGQLRRRMLIGQQGGAGRMVGEDDTSMP